MAEALRCTDDRLGRKRRLGAVAMLLAASFLLQGNIGRIGALEDRVLAAHNRERAAVGVAPLVWDDTLAASAAEWAAHLTRLNDLEHYPDDSGDSDPEGENLWLGTRGYFTPEDMVGDWIAEKRNYRPGIFPANSRTGNLEDVGHYTQLVWRTTGRVGCAVAHNRDYDFLVCRYLEGGNVIGERPI